MRGPSNVPAGFLSILVLILVATHALPAAAQTTLTAAFDWRMPDRLSVDEEGRVTNYANPADVTPTEWPVLFDACASTVSITSYEWLVDGQPAGESATCDGFTFAFPDEGTYEVALIVHEDGATATVEQEVLVQDYLIVAMGDSYASGEGNPDIPIPTSAWTEIASLAEDLAAAIRDRDDAIEMVSNLQGAVSEARDNLDEAVAALQEVQSELAALIALMGDVNALYQAVLSAERAVEDARARRNASCPLPIKECAEAEAALRDAQATLAARRAALAAELTRLGFQNFSAFRDYFEATRDELQSIIAARETAKSVAEAALADAQAALADALVLLDQLQDLVAASKEALGHAAGDTKPVWGVTEEDRRCHRASASGQVQAALKLEREDPRTSVTLVHLACSGATITEGLIGKYMGMEDVAADSIAPQVSVARMLAGRRTVDALVISIGGNDIKFGPLVEKCMAEEPCFDPEDDPAYKTALEEHVHELCGRLPGAGLPDAELPVDLPYQRCVDHLLDREVLVGDATAIFDSAFAELAGLYGALRDSLAAYHPHLPPDRIYITEYPDLTKDHAGAYCGFDPDADPSERLMQLPGLSSSEFAWADANPLQSLNGALADLAQDHGWQIIDGIYEPYERHGYCSAEGWVVRIQESLLQQKDPYGTVHPNRPGHDVYADRIYEALAADLRSSAPGHPTETPAAPVLSAPEDAATLPPGEVVLEWSSAPHAATYDLQVALVEDFSSVAIDRTALTDTTFALTDLDAEATYYWRVRGVNGAGESSYSASYRFTMSPSGVSAADSERVPEQFGLAANYPNPFNPQTTIGYDLAEPAHVRLVVFDMLGREVQRLVDAPQAAGRYEAVFDASRLASGVYVYRLDAGRFNASRRMLLAK